MMSNIEHENTDEIVCPWCGDEFTDSWEMSDDGEYDCDCGKSFEYERVYDITYNTFRKKCEDEGCRLKLREKDWGENPYIMMYINYWKKSRKSKKN